MTIGWRYRSNWRGKLILQIGRRAVSFYGMPYLDWEDATVEDITREGRLLPYPIDVSIPRKNP